MPDPRSRLSSRPSVLMIGSEAVPFAKTGGLADVLGALPPALERLGWEVTLVLPRYRSIWTGTLVDRIAISVGDQVSRVGFFEASLGAAAQSARAILVDAPELFDRDGLYASDNVDYADNPHRFAVLARAALEWAARQAVRPTVVHAHDWQTGLVPVYLKTLYASHPMLAGTPSVFTIHNLAYQGLFPADWMPRLDLPSTVFSPDGLEFWGKLSFLKGGINFARAITTVSPRYAAEIQSLEFGCGFDGVLRQRAAVLSGILNGIDTDQWDPQRDPHLPAHYSAGDPAGKATVKTELLSRFGFPRDGATRQRPLIGMISRMVDQKGLDLIASLGTQLPLIGATFVILGTGEPKYEQFWRTLAADNPDRIGVRVGFDEPLAHLIEGGSDMFLMPSRFEPCGLNQMYSLRYGTVPIVRAVGGLADTVREGVTGFVFHEYTPEALLETLLRAVAAFAIPPKWRELQAAGMKQDHSWDRSAREYVTIYEQVSANHG
jgi:starch synthase